ncbi:WD domain G-beta repeat protein [Theileria parva strain Muguga]|uniref:WD domain G-beta repeat protein n=1 Tax=Theileria parva strain Muguga TaxID=333668 RepID=UPI001C622BD3|nr:WD domain G-beta repeat protein [Theileria parva strain Muguga]KAF5153700.1 WD domain G-beta repeat protein [Theileria parva strain Muguga]
MESDEGYIYKSPSVVWPQKGLLLYGSGTVLYVFDYKESKLSKKLQYSEPNQFVRSIYIDEDSVVVGFDNKVFTVYDSSFNVLLTRKFNKKISFIALSEGNVIICDFFGDVSILKLDLDSIKSSKNRNIDSKLAEEKNIKASEDTTRNKLTSGSGDVIVPFSHYSTITSSLIYNDLLFTGNKDGKIFVNSLSNLHEIKNIYLSHKMSISCLDVREDLNLLLSLSIDDTIRFWNIKTGLEVYRIIIENMKCLSYYFKTRRNLIILLCLDEILVINFSFIKLQLLGYQVYKLPFTAQMCTFLEDTLFIIDDYSSLYKIDSINGVGTDCKVTGNKIAIPVNSTVLENVVCIYKGDNKCNKINIKKNVNV